MCAVLLVLNSSLQFLADAGASLENGSRLTVKAADLPQLPSDKATRIRAGTTSDFTDPHGDVWLADTGFVGKRNNAMKSLHARRVPTIPESSDWFEAFRKLGALKLKHT